jgi:hypothetical protein
MEGSDILNSMMSNTLTDEEREVSNAVKGILVTLVKEKNESTFKDMNDVEFEVLRKRLHDEFPVTSR